MSQFKLDIAGFKISFGFKFFNPGFEKDFYNRYFEYFTSGSVKNNIDVNFSNENFKNDDNVELLENKYLNICRKDFCFSNKNGISRLFIRPDIYSFDSFLRVYISHLLNSSDGLLVHSSGVVFSDKAFLFIGRSGAGKSTIAKIFSRLKILSDELIPLRFKENKIIAFSSPFWGEIKSKNNNVNALVKKIFLIKKDKKNFELFIDKKDAVLKIVRCVMNFNKSIYVSQDILKKVELLCNFQLSILAFRKSKSLIGYFRNKKYIQ